MASREQDKSPDKAIDGLLRRSLARTAPSQDCPGPDILAAYYDRSLDSRKIAHYELHFSTCAHCRAQLAAMVRAGEPEAAKKEAGGWGWLTHRWWFVPALATAALALVVSVPLMRRIYQPVPTQVAMNAPARAAAPASDSERDEATSADTQLLDRASGKTAPHAAPTGTPEKKKDLRLAAPPQGESDAKSASPHPLSKTQDAGRTPAVADSLTVQSEPAPSAPASSVAARRSAPAQSTARSSGARSSGTGSSGAGAAGGFTAQNQVRQQNQRQNQQSNQPQNQQQNESTAQVQSQTVQVEAQAREEHKERQAGSASSGAIGGAAAPAPRSDSKQVTEAAPLYSADGKLVLRGDKAAVRNAKKSSVLRIYSSPDDDSWWRLPGDGYVEFSRDAGENWHRQLLDRDAQLLTGAAPGGRVFWIVGREGVIYLTTNGTKWKRITPPDNADLIAITARDARSASITASDRRLFTTEDGGKTWHTAAP